MYDNSVPPIGAQIRALRKANGLTLADLARRAGTSAPTLHRYESGWNRFQVATLRRIAAALGARLEIRVVPREKNGDRKERVSIGMLAELLAPLFWDRQLESSDVERYPQWVLRRVLAFGNRAQVGAARRFYGDEACRRAATHRSTDPRTRNYWLLMLGEG